MIENGQLDTGGKATHQTLAGSKALTVYVFHGVNQAGYASGQPTGGRLRSTSPRRHREPGRGWRSIRTQA